MALRVEKPSLISLFTWLLVILIVVVSSINIALGWRHAEPSVQPLSGRLLEGELVGPATFANATCILVRFESRWCQFSRADSSTFDVLERAALAEGCESLIMAPNAGSYLCQPGSSSMHPQHRHLSHPTFASAKALRLTATPTTIILDRSYRAKWRKVGTLAEGDVEVALKSVGVRGRRSSTGPSSSN